MKELFCIVVTLVCLIGSTSVKGFSVAKVPNGPLPIPGPPSLIGKHPGLPAFNRSDGCTNYYIVGGHVYNQPYSDSDLALDVAAYIPVLVKMTLTDGTTTQVHYSGLDVFGHYGWTVPFCGDLSTELLLDAYWNGTAYVGNLKPRNLASAYPSLYSSSLTWTWSPSPAPVYTSVPIVAGNPQNYYYSYFLKFYSGN